MKSTPVGWPRVSSSLVYQDARKAIAWLSDAFGFEPRLVVEGEGDRIEHSELVFGDGLLMVGSGRPNAPHRKSPLQVAGANTQALMVFVDDVEAHCDRARAAGAVIVQEPTTSDYGEDFWVDRTYECVDLEGHHWWFVQRMSDPMKPPPSKRVARK